MGLEELARTQRLRWAKGLALSAAASSWAGISAIHNRDRSILETADKFVVWLLDDSDKNVIEADHD